MSITWYAHYLGDYAKKTSHLSLVEHGAYRLLIDHAYSHDGFIPSDHKSLHRICSAVNQHERKAVDRVVTLFFKLAHDGFLTQERIWEEVSRRKEISDLRRKVGAIAHSNALQNDGKKGGNNSHSHKVSKKEAPLRSASQGEGLFADPDKSQPLKEKKNGKTKLSADFEPESATRLLATQLGVDLAACLTEFKDWCASKEPRYHDWQATFRNSVRRFSKSRGQRQGRGGFERPGPASVAEAALRVAARHAAKDQN